MYYFLLDVFVTLFDSMHVLLYLTLVLCLVTCLESVLEPSSSSWFLFEMLFLLLHFALILL